MRAARSARDLEGRLRAAIAAALRVAPAELPRDRALVELGLDSLSAAELRHRLAAELGLSLSFAELLDSGLDTLLLAAGRAEARRPAALAAGEEDRGDGPLSYGQRALWFAERSSPVGGIYNIAAAAWLSGPVEPDALRGAFERLVSRHEALRTAFFEVDGEPRQRVLEDGGPDFAEVDARGWEPDRVSDWLRGEAWRPFELESGRPLRVRLVDRGAGERILLLAVHHLVADLRSLEVLAGELAAVAADAAVSLPPLPARYGSFVDWQERLLASSAGEVLEQDWLARLSGQAPLLQLADRPRPGTSAGPGALCRRPLPSDLAARLSALASAWGATPFAALLAAFQVLLQRFTGQRDLWIGTPAAGRGLPELADLVGCFVNPLVLRTEVADAAFIDHLAAVRRTVLTALERQDYPFSRLVERLQPERLPGVTPLFQALFVYQRTRRPELRELPMLALGEPGARLALGPWTLAAVPLPERPAHLDLTLEVCELGSGLAAAIHYRSDLIDGATADRLLGTLETLLRAAVAEPGLSITHLPLLTEAERGQLQVWSEGGPLPAPGEGACLHDLVAAQAERTPEAVAVVDGEASVTYRQLRERAAGLAAHLRRMGVGPETRVGVCTGRSRRMVASALAVLEAGGAYVPLDPAQPAERLAWVMADASVALILTEPRLAPRLPRPEIPRVLVSDGADESAGEGTAGPRPLPGNLAYVIYTSGSTGRPKGVAIEHRSAVALVRWARQAFAAANLRHVLASTSLASTSRCSSSSHLSRRAARWSWRRMSWRSPRCRPPVASGQHRAVGRRRVGALRRAATVGPYGLPGRRAAPRGLVERLYDLGVEGVFNFYGPTETTTYSTGGRIGRGLPGLPSIGRPLAGERMWILDAQGAPVPVGVPGELFLGGAGVARGYLGRPDLTAERFVPDPFAGDGDRLYRTGDLARWRPDGEIEFLGRADQQVKLRGFRIEPGEIEACARAPSVGARGGRAGPRQDVGGLALVAWVAPGERLAGGAGRAPAPPPSGAHGAGLLVGLDTLPLHAQRQARPPGPARPRAGRTARRCRRPSGEPHGGGPGRLFGPRCSAGSSVGVHDSFFELGGHSLLAVRLLSRVRQALHVDLPASALFEAPTVARLAGVVEDARRGAPRPPVPPLVRAPRGGDLPLTSAQRRLWFLQELEPASAAYNMAAAVRLRGPLDRAALRRAVGELGRRHEPLRTAFLRRDRQPVQEILPELEIGVREVAPRVAPTTWAREEAARPFDLAAAPLARFSLLALPEPEDHLLLVVLHHLIADGGSIGVLIEELAALYGAFTAGRPSPLPEPGLQLADYAVWQERWPPADELERQLADWWARLDGLAPLDLPTDLPRPAAPDGRGEVRSLPLPAEVAEAVAGLGRREAATPFMVLLAGFLLLLHRYTGQDDLAVGAPVSQRSGETERLIGMLVNVLVLRVSLAGGSVRDLLHRVRSAVLAGFAHQDLPFDRLVAALRPERGAGAPPLVEAAFVLQDEPWPAPRAAGLSLAATEVHNGAAKFDLTLSVARRPEGLHAAIEYRSALFDGATAERWLGHFAALLHAAADPAADLLSLPLLREAERHQLLIEGNDTAAAVREAGLVHERIARRAAEQPDAPAVVAGPAGEFAVTYEELNRQANRLARHLRSLGVGPEVKVGVHLDRGPELIVGLLAVLKAGGAFLPLEPGLPADRLDFLVRDARAPLVLSRHRLDCDAAVIAAHDSGDLPPLASPENLAYVLYTSGSTGRPKGVEVPHSGLLSLIDWHLGRYGLGPDHRVSQVAALGFDASVWEIFPALAAGSSLWLAPSELRAAPADLLTWMERCRIDVAFLPTPVAERAVALAREGARIPAVVLTGGDRLRVRPPEGTAFELVNHYGPTEASVVATAGTVEPAAATLPSLGRPIANVRLYLLGAGMAPVPPGARGEIFLGGPLARGYLGRPELTAAAFVPDPFASAPGGRLYRTGDLARLRQDGRLEFLGRADQQVKVRGVRIEPGEVEAALRACPAVAEAVAGVRESRPGDLRLVAWFVPAGDPPVSGLELAAFLRERLPETMVPAAFVPVAAIPLTANGKVDRRALPDPELAAGVGERVAPRTPLEEVLTGMWSEVLGRESEAIGIHDSFFDLGGHSLLATELIGVVRDAFYLDVPLRALLDAPTVASLAEALLRHPGGREHVEETAGLLLRLATTSEEEAESLLAGGVR